jgi:hypothetical protein
MPRMTSCLALVGILALGACAAPIPTGPSVMAMPAQGKSFEQFQQDDGLCRQYASQQIGNGSPSEAAANSGVTSAAVGTLLGAAAGAAIGAASGNPALGAAAGAGGGLLLGGAAGANAAQVSGATLQQRYDMGYIQCMAAKGESVPRAVSGGSPYPYYGYGPYAYPYPAYPAYSYGPPVYGSLFVGGRFH